MTKDNNPKNQNLKIQFIHNVNITFSTNTSNQISTPPLSIISKSIQSIK